MDHQYYYEKRGMQICVNVFLYYISKNFSLYKRFFFFEIHLANKQYINQSEKF